MIQKMIKFSLSLIVSFGKGNLMLENIVELREAYKENTKFALKKILDIEIELRDGIGTWNARVALLQLSNEMNQRYLKAVVE